MTRLLPDEALCYTFIMTTDIQIPFDTATFSAYYTTPDIPDTYPALILIHEIWGLNDHIKDVANRLQKQGYAVLAPDLLSETGVSPKVNPQMLEDMKNPVTRDEAQKKWREETAPVNSPEFAEETIAKLRTCFEYLQKQEKVHGKIGVVGFCFGGTYSFALAAQEPQLKAAVPFYGHVPEPEKLQQINCPILAFYGEKDTELVSKLPELNETMAAFHKKFLAIQYPDCGHAFFNDTNPNTYNKEAADDAWERTLAFLKENL
jgi:carboxymethylenebutenolidase